MTRGKSGEAIAELLMETLGPDYNKVTENIKGGTIVTTTEERVSLNCAQKLFAVCGDNATPNNTFCDHPHKRLLQNFDDNPTSFSDLPRCRFRGRSSCIRCVAYIITLIVQTVLKQLKSGTYDKAVKLVNRVHDNGGNFSNLRCDSLSV
jgi:hypothetical protein